MVAIRRRGNFQKKGSDMLSHDSHSPQRDASGEARAHDSRTTRYVKNKDLNRLLIETAEKQQWAQLDSYLTQISAHEHSRGAPFLKALNTAVAGSDMPLLAAMLCKNAPLPLIERVIEFGASPAFRCSVREPSGRVVGGCTLMHLALILGRLDVVSRVSPRISRLPLENAIGESPLRQFARLAPAAAYENESIIKAISVAARRYLGAGGSAAEVSRAISLMFSRKAWAGAEAILDTIASFGERDENARVKGSDLCKWALYGVYEAAPSSTFESIRGVSRAGARTGPLEFHREFDKAFLQKFVPKGVLDPMPTKLDWGAFEARLERLALCGEIFGPRVLYDFINVRNDRITIPPINAELEKLGLIEPVTQEKPLSLLHLMVIGAAPARCFSLAFQLGADSTYQAWVGRARDVIFDGTPVHLAVSRGDIERLKILIENRAPLSQLNSAGETELHHFFSRHNGDIPLSQFGLVELLLRAGGEPANRSGVTGRPLHDLYINGFRFGDLLKAAKEFNPANPIKGEVRVARAAVTYQVIRDKKLVDVDEWALRQILLAEYLRHFPNRGDKEVKHLEDLKNKQKVVDLKNSTVRDLVEQIQNALKNSLHVEAADSLSREEQLAPNTGHESDDVDAPDEFQQVEEGEGFLSFPDFSGEEFGFTYKDPDLEDDTDLENRDLDLSAEFEIIEDEALVNHPDSAESAPETLPALPLEKEETPKEKPKAFEKSLLDSFAISEDEILSLLSEGKKSDVFGGGDFDDDVGDLGDFDDLEIDDEGILTTGGLSMAAAMLMGLATSGRNSPIHSAIVRCIEEGEHYEAYLLIKCLDELRVNAPTPLDAISRSLRSLLYRFPPTVANSFGQSIDGIGLMRRDGYHPYMAELCCMLHNPLDRMKNAQSIGGLTLGISSVAQLYHFGSVTGELVDAWGDLGTWNFAFPIWRFDTQPIQLGTTPHGSNSLMERAGFLRITGAADEYQVNPITKVQEHLLGALFLTAQGSSFHDQFDYLAARSLGFAPLGRETVVAFRRACILVSHPSHGTLVIRNSSHTFGRDRFRHFASWSPRSYSKTKIVGLTQKEIERDFMAVTSSTYFRHYAPHDSRNRLTHSINELRRDNRTIQEATQPLTFLIGQATTVRAALSRMKFDANISTAWSPEGQMIGGYRSPLFASMIDLIEDRYRAAQTTPGKIVVPDLGFANPDYFLAPHARLNTTKASLAVLRLLADGKENQVTERALYESGVRDFLNAGFMRSRNSEIVMLAPEKER